MPEAVEWVLSQYCDARVYSRSGSVRNGRNESECGRSSFVLGR